MTDDIETETPLANDIRATHIRSASGFQYVRLYDPDDEFLLNEDEIKSLHKYLGALIQREGL